MLLCLPAPDCCLLMDAFNPIDVSSIFSIAQKESKGVYTKLMLEIAEQGLMPVGSVEDWATSKRIARLP